MSKLKWEMEERLKTLEDKLDTFIDAVQSAFEKINKKLFFCYRLILVYV